jgi:hypothetical protein
MLALSSSYADGCEIHLCVTCAPGNSNWSVLLHAVGWKWNGAFAVQKILSAPHRTHGLRVALPRTFVSGPHQHHKQSRFAKIFRPTRSPDGESDTLATKDAGPRRTRFRARIRFDREEAALGV